MTKVTAVFFVVLQQNTNAKSVRLVLNVTPFLHHLQNKMYVKKLELIYLFIFPLPHIHTHTYTHTHTLNVALFLAHPQKKVRVNASYFFFLSFFLFIHVFLQVWVYIQCEFLLRMSECY